MTLYDAILTGSDLSPSWFRPSDYIDAKVELGLKGKR